MPPVAAPYRPLRDKLVHAAQLCLRALGRNRLPSLVILVTLALGIGSSAAIFTVVYAVVLRPLPFPDPERLVAVWSTQRQEGIDRGPISMADYLDWRDSNRSFDAIAVIQDSSFALTGEGEPEEIVTAWCLRISSRCWAWNRCSAGPCDRKRRSPVATGSSSSPTVCGNAGSAAIPR